MKNNIGAIDKGLRILAIIVFVCLFFTGIIGGFLAFICFVLLGQFIVTGLLSYCPAYHFFGINTCKRHKMNGASYLGE